LLYGDDGVGQKGGFPFGKAVAPVAVDAFDAGDAVFGDFFEQAVDDVGRGIVGVGGEGGGVLFYSELNLNQYSVASPCRTICTVCGSSPCPDLNLIHYIY